MNTTVDLAHQQIQQALVNYAKTIRGNIQSFTIERLSIVTGGDIHRAYKVETQQNHFFIKLNDAQFLSVFQTEFEGLSEIAKKQSIRVPKALFCGQTDKAAFLILEYLNLASNGSITCFAKALAKMHLNFAQSFGFKRDNYIGLTPQSNRLMSEWPEFFAKERLIKQIQLLEKKYHGDTRHQVAKLVKLVKELALKVDGFFKNYTAKPSLLHGDLWQGNLGFIAESGEPCIYDPACYYGDHECDLAMLELFGHMPVQFYQKYHSVFPIDSGFEKRKDLYNLYHILNHANLFGGHYLQQAKKLAEGLLKTLTKAKKI